jgi:hypothetical protein
MQQECRGGNQSFSVYLNFSVLEILTLGGQEASVPVYLCLTTEPAGVLGRQYASVST